MSTELLIKNARVWPAAGQSAIEDGSLLIRDGRIAKVGRFTARADVTVDADGQLLMPGFIQSHVHLCQTIFRGAGEDMPLLPWLRNVVWPMEAAHDEDSIRASALLACAEMIRSGTTAFLSMETVRHTEHAFRAVHDAGLMGVLGHCLMDMTGGYRPLAVEVDDSFADLDLLQERWGDHPRLRVAVAPRFALSCSASNMRKAADYAREYGLLLHTHSSEQEAEVALVLEQTGKYNIDYLHSVGLTGPDSCIAHCVHTQPAERDLLRDTQTKVLHCPSANFKLASGIAPIPEYLKMGITVSIGADGTPCNNRLDQFMEMREAGLMQKIRLGAEALPARDVVWMATEGGAKTLGWEKEMGTLDVGKRANMILVSQDSVHTIPSTDPATNIVYSNNASDVLMTIVDGKILFEDGELTTIDEDKLRADVRHHRKLLMKRAGLA
ncbi:MAG TPA: amidohydrolase family protein [Kiritimatiellia bacterium]|nr:amidohydrolase family protein [Kiritimatiellia bacterium]